MSRIRLSNYVDLTNGSFEENIKNEFSRGCANLSFVNFNILNDYLYDIVSPICQYIYEGGVVVAFDCPGTTKISFKDHGLKIVSEMVWVHPNAPLSFGNTKSYFKNFVSMTVFSYGPDYVFNAIEETCKHSQELENMSVRMANGHVSSVDAKFVNNIRPRSAAWVGLRDYGKKDPSVQILKDHIVSWTNGGMSIVDWTASEGHCIEAARDLDRDCLCIFQTPDDMNSAKETYMSNGKKDDSQMTFAL